jgi:UPF0176 protein
MTQTTNIAAYHFLPLVQLEDLQLQIETWARDLELKGTVLIAHEGINLFLAGASENIATFLGFLLGNAQFISEKDRFEVKYSLSEAPPFKRLKVKIKREIIRMDVPTIAPNFAHPQGRAASVDAHTLKRWLDQGHDDDGREVVMLDTRNDFEVDAGKFTGAIDWRITKFTEFAQALRDHAAELKNKTVVSYCTGGIRCEKAAMFMRQEGVDNVLQLHGGILKYFEAVGQAHYEGNCFVFDERRGVDADLSPIHR